MLLWEGNAELLATDPAAVLQSCQCAHANAALHSLLLSRRPAQFAPARIHDFLLHFLRSIAFFHDQQQQQQQQQGYANCRLQALRPSYVASCCCSSIVSNSRSNSRSSSSRISSSIPVLVATAGSRVAVFFNADDATMEAVGRRQLVDAAVGMQRYGGATATAAAAIGNGNGSSTTITTDGGATAAAARHRGRLMVMLPPVELYGVRVEAGGRFCFLKLTCYARASSAMQCVEALTGWLDVTEPEERSQIVAYMLKLKQWAMMQAAADDWNISAAGLFADQLEEGVMYQAAAPISDNLAPLDLLSSVQV